MCVELMREYEAAGDALRQQRAAAREVAEQVRRPSRHRRRRRRLWGTGTGATVARGD